MDFQKVSDWIEAHEDDMVELQRGLTALPALAPENGGKGEWEKARFLEDYLRRSGLDRVEHFDCPDERVPEGTRPNLIASVPGPEGQPALWILTHMDVVPPGERLPDGSWKGWDGDPYTMRREGDLLIGRGVMDNQQALVSAVYAARAVLENGAAARPVRLIFVSDEEVGSRHGLDYILRTAPEVFRPEDLFVVPDWGKPDGAEVEVAEKSLLWFECHATGKQAHASRPDLGVNAFRAAAALVGMLDRGLHDRFDRVDHVYDTPGSTFEPTRHPANVPNVNTMPGEETFAFDCRVLPSYGLDDVLAFAEAECGRADAAYGTQTELAVLARRDAPPPTPPDADVVQRLCKAVRAVHGLTPQPTGTGGQTVAAPLRARGLRVACWGTMLETAHEANERCSIAHMVADARVFGHMMVS